VKKKVKGKNADKTAMPEINSRTALYAVLGSPINHSLSPVMHNAAFRHLGMNALYLALNVTPPRLSDTIKAMAGMNFKGVNITVPLKETAFRLMRHIDKQALPLGAINTVKFTDGITRGYNTDTYGFVTAIQEHFSLSLNGLTVLMLGCGGAGRAIALTCARKHAKEILLCDTDRKRSGRLALDLSMPGTPVKREAIQANQDEMRKACRKADLIVQATPIGMKKTDQPLLDRNAFRPEQALFDLVYMHRKTGIMKEASRAGAKTANGLSMLLHQGAKAFEIWTKRKAPVKVMRKELERKVYGGEQ